MFGLMNVSFFVKQKREFLLSYGSLWSYLEGLKTSETKTFVLTPEAKARLQAELDLLFTQCVVDVSD
jgi:hypothetical protein